MISKQIFKERIILSTRNRLELEQVVNTYVESGWQVIGKIRQENGNVFKIDVIRTDDTQPIEIIKEVEIPIEVEKIVEVPVEVPVEVIREVEVPIEVEKIVEIPADPNLQSKTITENGTYQADDGYDGLSSVVVDVPEVVREVEVPIEIEKIVEVPVQPVLQEKIITENGTYEPDEGYDGFSKIIIDISEGAQPSEAPIEEDEVYDGTVVTINILQDQTEILIYISSGSVYWGDLSSNSYIGHIQPISHLYNKGTYKLYFSSDFQAYNDTVYWHNVEITSIGGKDIKSLNFRSANCSNLLTLEDGVQNISEYAFYESNLSSLNFPSSLKTIEKAAFYYSSLETVNFSINGQLKSIGSSAFSDTNITSVILPQTVNTLANACLYNVKTITVLNPTPIRMYGAFSEVEHIYVPYSADHSVLNAYKTADGWSSYANIIYESDPE